MAKERVAERRDRGEDEEEDDEDSTEAVVVAAVDGVKDVGIKEKERRKAPLNEANIVRTCIRKFETERDAPLNLSR